MNDILPHDQPAPAAPGDALYRVAVVATVYLAPRSVAQTTLPADSLITGYTSAVAGWIRWEQDGQVRGYLHRGDLDRIEAAP